MLGVPKEPLKFNVDQIVDREITIEGTNTGSPSMIRSMMKWIAENDIRIPVKLYPIDQVNNILEDMEHNRLTTRVVLEIHTEPI